MNAELSRATHELGDSLLSRALAWCPDGPSLLLLCFNGTQGFCQHNLGSEGRGWRSASFLHSLSVRCGLWLFLPRPASSRYLVSAYQGCRWCVAVYPTFYMSAGIITLVFKVAQ